MANKIQIKRGLKSQLPTLNIGEFGLCTDTKEIFLGTADENIQLADNEKVVKNKNYIVYADTPPKNLSPVLTNGSDQTTNFQNLINYLVSKGGGTLILPLGEIIISNTVILPKGSKNITLQGQSSNAYDGTILKGIGNIQLLHVFGNDHMIEKISFTNSQPISSKGINAIGVGIYILPEEIPQKADNLKIRNCSFFNLEYGILNKSANIKIQNNLFSYMKSSGIRSIGWANPIEVGSDGQDYVMRDIEITSNRFHGSNGKGIMFNENSFHKEILITNNIFDDTSDCIFGNLFRSTISNNVMGRCRGYGIYVLNPSSNEPITISNNTINGISGILDANATKPTTGYEVGDGIYVLSRDSTIIGNIINNKSGHGINIANGSNFTIVIGNTIINADNYNTKTYNGINISADQVCVSSNMVRNTTTGGKQFYSLKSTGSGCKYDSVTSLYSVGSSGTAVNFA